MTQRKSFTLLEFQDRFNNEAACREHLFNVRWPNGFSCPNCGGQSYGYISTRGLYQCKVCRHQTSLTAGTVMHRSRTPLRVWFWAIYLVACDKRGCSALSVSKALGISYWKAWTMLHKIRRAMSKRDTDYKLCGLIEMDDAYFGSPKEGGKRGRGTTKAKTIVSVSTSSKGNPMFAKMDVIDQIDQETIHNVASKEVVQGSTIKSDGLNVYSKLPDKGYLHTSTVIKDTNVCKALPWLHILVSNAKAFIAGTYHGLGRKHLQAYLDEFCYRFNRRFWEDQLFERLLYSCVSVQALKFAELTQ